MAGKLGVIIPYRPDEVREQQLEEVIPAVSSYLRNFGIAGSIVVVDQLDKSPFNRGKLCNIGADYFADKDKAVTHFCFHDVDLIPIKADYSLTDFPVRVSIKITGGERDGGLVFFGGVTLVSKKVYYAANGHSNVFYGWGGEDDDLKHRFELLNIHLDQRKYGEFIHLEHSVAKRDMNAHAWKMGRREAMMKGVFDFQTDGMNSLDYSITDVKAKGLYTHLGVVTDGSDKSKRDKVFYSGWTDGVYKHVPQIEINKNKRGNTLAVVVCTMNNASLLRRVCDACLLSSLVSQLILVDNKSTDGTIAYIKSLKDKRVFLIENKKNNGCIKARNQGIAASKSTYTMILDDDQIPGGNTFIEYLTTLKYYDVVGCEMQIMNFKTGLTTLGTRSNFTYVGAGGMCMLTSDWVRLGLFDEIFGPAYFEDPDIIEKAKSVGLIIGHVKNHGINHIGHQTLSKQGLGFNKDSVMVRNRRIFIRRYKDKSDVSFIKNNKVKVLYVVREDDINDLLGNVNLFSKYDESLLDVRVHLEVTGNTDCVEKVIAVFPDLKITSSKSYKVEVVGGERHILYRNVGTLTQSVCLNNGNVKIVKPGGSISSSECRDLHLIASFRFLGYDRPKETKDTSAIMLFDSVNEFKPHIVYYKQDTNLGFVSDIKGIKAFRRESNVTSITDTTCLKGYDTIVALEECNNEC